MRLLALDKKHKQIFDLADILEIIPSLIVNYKEEGLEIIRKGLEDYKKNYPQTTFGYIDYLDGDGFPEF